MILELLCCSYLEFRPAYHNDYHGADVLQTAHCLLIKSSLLHVFAHTEITALVREVYLLICIETLSFSSLISYLLQ